MTTVASPPTLASLEIHEVLSNERRSMMLEVLRDHGGIMSTRALSEQIAALETDESPPPENVRQSVYVSLHQTHLPKLNELDIIEYDRDVQEITLTDRAREVGVYMETVPRYGIAWSEYYVGVSVLGLLLLAASAVGVPFISAVGAVPWALASLFLIVVSAVYQTISQGSSIVTRLIRAD